MANRSAEQIRGRSEMAKQVIKHYFGVSPKKTDYKNAGLTNYVFETKISAGEFIVRIANTPEKINDFVKEQWATSRARQAGIPVPEILDVGDGIIRYPYMIQRKTQGMAASHHTERKKIIQQMGSYAKLIHSIPTSNYGSVFDWSDNQSKNYTWKQYLKNELNVSSRLGILESHQILSPANMKILLSYVERIKKWKFEPVLNHGDIRLKNVIVNDAGKIMALLDWENCISHIAPIWELSIALHDLTIDDKQEFLKGYGLHADVYKENVYAMKTFNILNYIEDIQGFVDRQQIDMLEQYRLRLNGYYDLFSL